MLSESQAVGSRFGVGYPSTHHVTRAGDKCFWASVSLIFREGGQQRTVPIIQDEE